MWQLRNLSIQPTSLALHNRTAGFLCVQLTEILFIFFEESVLICGHHGSFFRCSRGGIFEGWHLRGLHIVGGEIILTRYRSLVQWRVLSCIGFQRCMRLLPSRVSSSRFRFLEGHHIIVRARIHRRRCQTTIKVDLGGIMHHRALLLSVGFEGISDCILQSFLS